MFENIGSLWLLFSSGFLSATLLPGGSEITFVYLLNNDSTNVILLIAIATIGNTLGGMVNYLLGRLIPSKTLKSKYIPKANFYLNKYGYFCLLFSWLPIIGDPLCLVAGWLRFNPSLCFVFITVGKCFRYALLAGTVLTVS